MNPLPLIAAFSGLAAVALFIAMQRRLGRLSPSIVSLQLSFSEAGFRAVLDAWKERGVDRFRSHFPLDYLFLVTYAVFGLACGSWIVESLGASGLAAAILPWLLPAAAAFDLAENMLHQRLLAAMPGAVAEPVFAVAGCVASIKWLQLGAFLPLAAIVALQNAA